MVGDSPDIVGEGSVSDLGDLEGWWDNPSIVIWSFALFGCFLLNVTLLLAFLIRPSLRTISNRFVMNLTVSNLLVCATINPLMIMDASSSPTTFMLDATFTENVCAMSEGAVAMVTTSSVFSVLLIAVDQYFAVVDPLRYRTRVDKLKSGILIVSTWLISIVFGSLAFFNPNPRGFWLSCIPRNVTSSSNLATVSESTITLLQTESKRLNATGVPSVLDSLESMRVGDDIDLIENTTVIFDTLLPSTITYGFVYALVYSIFAYFLPFAAVCWIYVSIYVAAHRNSERARRSGSRPILSSASFSEEQYGPRLQRLHADTIEDFRKLPKISSLSSIDETSETMQPTGQLSRRRSFSPSLEIEVSAPVTDDQPSSGIVFTVGSLKVEVSSENDNRENREANNDPIVEENLDNIDSQEKPGQEQRPLEIAAAQENNSDTWNLKNFQEASDSEDNTRIECYNNLDVFEKNRLRYERKISSSFHNYRSALADDSSRTAVIIDRKEKEEETCDDRLKQELAIETDENRVEPVRDPESIETNPISRLNGSCADEGKSCEELVRTFGSIDVGPRRCNSSSTICNKTERDNVELSTCLLTPIVTITPAPSKNDALHRVSSVRSTSSYISSLKDRISNGSIFRHREETRAARISALVIVMGLICWSPYVILLVMNNLPRSVDQYLPRKYDALASGFLILAAYVSPLLFGYRSRRVKRELRRFFCFRRELSYKNNRSLMAKKVLKRRHSSTLSHLEVDHKYNIFNCMYGRNRWPKEKVQFVQVPDTALAVETCRSSFSSGASTQISSTSTDEC
ncbi:uncharacterized protein LOC116427090 [Nomia melanderi]|uniref:uncharacterized protein LOC116427090 n=1 Tax=Nomia melanderi TaxID=2448451 RepID=UPI00130418D3|nr:uncharacterized protein LOC116427090 [Nomia melanderi]XP_031832909.1 uncharacterized protein LOC116427090 [Nomia melanderi]XP_031832919.1 uncharacterized protein LOC116427090 [Nomia melanderi]XP_031832925.1 uncharacterized protein LOC116427090 [Nomia melanderi]XP_031832930.1 uncharacterized protein LOC116427090 [Nomia melanderi]XP_031832939.1 uncharacterized protein LOC116427090 [Nomia melanderi]XP_031832949.1 uncharacterized protein LOC116427090 [Nomia melanderi]